MTTVACPNGHQSTDVEWCDTCGAKIGGSPLGSAAIGPTGSAAVGQPASAPVVQAASVMCPHCAEPTPADALFCEVCGYDFTTGQAPASSPSTRNGPTLPQAMPPVQAAVAWIAVVEVDPTWYALKGALADRVRPAPSSSTVPLSNHSALIGRSSASHNVRPEVALDADTGVSRRHAQFVRDADSLTVVDLSSTNGTFVVAAGQEPEESTAPLVPGVPVELHDGDRVYVGAWTRLTVRSSPT